MLATSAGSPAPGRAVDPGRRTGRSVDVDVVDQSDLYLCSTLLDAAVPLALSSDTPYGPLDPWTILRAAVERRSRAGSIVGPVERTTIAAALEALLADPSTPGGPPRRVALGAPADLVLLDTPVARRTHPDPTVRRVWIGGRPIR